MIERWFPCAEVSEASSAGWGSGNTERNLFTWFAARPTAQAKAAIITSLLPWPDDETEQRRLQELVRRAMTGRYEAWEELREEILASNPNGAEVLDPFAGRGMIPLEAARLGLPSFALDYAPVATLASELLIDYPFRDWSEEPPLSFLETDRLEVGDRLLVDVEAVIGEVGRRFAHSMNEFYPPVAGRRPWGYLWSVTLPCQECGRRFPLFGSAELRRPSANKNDSGQSFYLETDHSGGFEVIVHEGAPRLPPTLQNRIGSDGKKLVGKAAVCPFCEHVHPLEVHRRLTNEGYGVDAALAVGEIDSELGKRFRALEPTELNAIQRAAEELEREERFGTMTPAVPNERIAPGNNNIIGPTIYGAKTYGDLMPARQTLGFVRLARIIGQLAQELTASDGVSRDYARALAGYAASVLVRRCRRATRGCTLDVSRNGVHDIFVNEGSLTFSYDYFEPGIGDGPGTWSSLSGSTLSTLRNLMADRKGLSATVIRGSATALPFGDKSFRVIVTDPPYDEMIAYADASDLFYVWLRRALCGVNTDWLVTSDVYGCQEKEQEIIVKRARGLAHSAHTEHRTREHYDRLIGEAFVEMQRVVDDDGLVTIVFGHGDPEVWHRLLAAISGAGLVLTGSWPAKTESGGGQGKANIVTTLTMACRPAPPTRARGRAGAVEYEVKQEVKARIAFWEKSGLAPTDMLMASAGPAMEVVGRYSSVLDTAGDPVEPDRYLITARQAVQEAAALEIEHHPLETFDARTRFALWWVRLYGRQVAAKSELRWQTLAADLELAEVRDLVPDSDKGCRLVFAKDFKDTVTPESAVINVALAMAGAWVEGLDAVGAVLVAADRDGDDSYLWGALAFLADRLPDADPDAIAWTGILRNRRNVGTAAKIVVEAERRTSEEAEVERAKLRLF